MSWRSPGHKRSDIIWYRCHTGHAYSADNLLISITENIEEALSNSLRGVEESLFFLNSFGEHYAEQNKPKFAATYFKKAAEAESRANLVKQLVLDHEQLTTGSIGKEAGETPGD